MPRFFIGGGMVDIEMIIVLILPAILHINLTQIRENLSVGEIPNNNLKN